MPRNVIYLVPGVIYGLILLYGTTDALISNKYKLVAVAM